MTDYSNKEEFEMYLERMRAMQEYIEMKKECDDAVLMYVQEQTQT